jgi:hypothetical protein
MKTGITVQCVSCKTKRTLTLDDAAKLDGVPMCEQCGMPCVAVAANVKARRGKRDLRDVFGR